MKVLELPQALVKTKISRDANLQRRFYYFICQVK